jgi:hypothetical protein
MVKLKATLVALILPGAYLATELCHSAQCPFSFRKTCRGAPYYHVPERGRKLALRPPPMLILRPRR